MESIIITIIKFMDSCGYKVEAINLKLEQDGSLKYATGRTINDGKIILANEKSIEAFNKQLVKMDWRFSRCKLGFETGVTNSTFIITSI